MTAHVSRRHLLAGLAGAAAVAGVAPARKALAQSATPSLTPQPAIYSRPVGDMTLTTLLDGSFAVQPQMLTNIDPATKDQLLTDAFLAPGGPVPVAISAHLLSGPGGLTLIDAGAGAFFGPAGGRLTAALAAIGVAPEQIDRIVLTHMHSDHVGGLVTDGAVTFPNATLHVHANELGFWTNETIRANAPEIAQPTFQRAQIVMNAWADRTETFSGDNGDLGGGLTTVDMSGHTPGHTGFRIASGDEQLIVWGDLTGIAALQFTRPETGLVFDIDGEASSQARRRVHDMVAADRIAVAGTHLPFPGVGYVDRRGDEYAWVPEEWRA